MYKKQLLPQSYITQCNEQHLEELWTVPWNTYHAATLDGMKLYSSSGLKSSFCEAMEKHKKTKNISKKIIELVDSKKIVPAWMNKGIFSLSIFKIFAPIGSQSIMGFYTPNENQIYLLMDNNITFGYASNNVLAELLLHESMHMASHQLRTRYHNIFSEELTKYYSALFKTLFGISGNIDRESKAIYNFLFKNCEYQNLTAGKIKTVIEKYTTLLVKFFMDKTTLDHKVFKEVITEYMTMIKLYFANINVFIASIKKYHRIYRGMKVAYVQGLGVKNTKSLCIQELVFPSEVICMYSELTRGVSSKVYKAFSGIK